MNYWRWTSQGCFLNKSFIVQSKLCVCNLRFMRIYPMLKLTTEWMALPNAAHMPTSSPTQQRWSSFCMGSIVFLVDARGFQRKSAITSGISPKRNTLFMACTWFAGCKTVVGPWRNISAFCGCDSACIGTVWLDLFSDCVIVGSIFGSERTFSVFCLRFSTVDFRSKSIAFATLAEFCAAARKEHTFVFTSWHKVVKNGMAT